MKVKYGTVWLTGAPWQEDAGAVGWSAQQLVQQVPLLRAATPFLAGRGNVADQITVPVHRVYGSPLAASRAVAELPWNLPNDGTLIFYEVDGDALITITFPKAAFNGITRRRIGREAAQFDCTFTVTGPPTVTTSDTGGLELYSESGEALTTE